MAVKISIPHARAQHAQSTPIATTAQTTRRLLHAPRSLRVQMAVGSALVALVAVFFVAAITVIAVAISFNDYQRTQLNTEASQVSVWYGQHGFPTASTGTVIAIAKGAQNGPPLPNAPFLHARFGASYVWFIDGASGKIVAPPAENAQAAGTITQDEATVTAALRQAMQGTTVEGSLQGGPGPFKLLDDRICVAVPVRENGASNGRIIGAVALTTPARAERNSVFAFLSEVNTTALFGALVVALLAALASTIFSRRLTRPLATLDAATTRMASGDYATRVTLRSPSEYQRLGVSFNEMAAALERDVAELHRQEQLRRELVANVSHELATPLTAIEGFTEALIDGVVHDPIAREETARTIAREAARLHRLVDQLRQVALFEAGAQALDRAALSLPTLVDETLDVLAPEIEQRRITLVNDLPQDLPSVYADGDRITEVLLNLFDNALRYTPVGGRIEVEGSATEKGVRVSIANSGAEIAPEQRGRIFERFYRADASRSSATGGSGLGLAIVKSLVEAHGGAIWVDERPGGGSRFTFTLPTLPRLPTSATTA